MGDTGLYIDPETGKIISTHSMLKTFRRCPKQAEYKYVERLQPKVLGRPLRLGTWMHKLQEVHGKGGDWREAHVDLSKKFNKLFDEEKEEIGDLPQQCMNLMLSYLWHYKNDNWKVLDSEFVLEVELPDGAIFRCKIDWLIEDQYGLWIVDHKWHKVLPDINFRLLDSQSADYVWAAIKNKIPVQGHIWNYGRSKVPTVPVITKTGLIGRWAQLDTDYPTMVRFFKEHFNGKVPERYKPKMRYLRDMQYRFGEAQHSNYFRRSILERTPAMINRVAREAYHTHTNMHNYDWNPEMVERHPDRSCSFMCSYTDLCTAELMTGHRPVNWRQRYKVGDPMYYYTDDEYEKENENA